MTHPADRYRLSVKGSLSEAAAGLIDDRYGAAARVVPDGPHGPDTVVELTGDQAGLRSLLGLLWDLGHEVQSVVRPDVPASP
jgi:hypothetical protein